MTRYNVASPKGILYKVDAEKLARVLQIQVLSAEEQIKKVTPTSSYYLGPKSSVFNL